MLQPQLASKKSIGIPELVYSCLMKCDSSVRAELLANITLSGGNTRFPGMEKRLYQELQALLPVRSLKDAVKVRALPHRDLLGWVGAARWVEAAALVHASALLHFTPIKGIKTDILHS